MKKEEHSHWSSGNWNSKLVIRIQFFAPPKNSQSLDSEPEQNMPVHERSSANQMFATQRIKMCFQ